MRALGASLRSMLEDETMRRGLDQRARLEWLSEQLEHYVERWLGFAAVPAVSRAALMAGDLFAMVQAGADAVTEELSAVGSAADSVAGWRGFLTELAAVREGGDPFEPERLRRALAEARAGFASAGW